MENIFVSPRRRKAMRLTQIASTAINRLVPGPLKKGCKSLLYSLTKPLWTDNTPLPSVEEAYALLNSVSPDPDNSCIRQNKILEPDCDLQIIVPVYNVEKYVEECIDSILNQKTEYTFKIVIVNDGSPDRSREILKKYESLPNVKIIDQENRGLSGARNSGLEEISGRYIMFVDSDDILTPGTLQKLLKKAEQTDADIVQGGYNIYTDGQIGQLCSLGNHDDFSPDCIYGFAWGKIYKASIWQSIIYPEGYLFEDTLTVMIIDKLAAKVSTIADSVYLYRQNPMGITCTYSIKPTALDALWITRRLLNDFKALNLECDPQKSQRELEALYIQARYAYSRTVTFSIQIRKAVFVALCHIINEFIGSIDAPKLQQNTLIQEALTTKNFCLFSKLAVN